MEVAVAIGENKFTMSRGSFKYKQKIHNKRTLIRKNVEQMEGGYLLIYEDTPSQERYIFKVEEQEGKIRLSYEEENQQGVNRYWLSFKTNPAEHIYGCGETYSELDLKGQNVRIWVAEHQNTGRISQKIIKEKLCGKHP